MTLTQMGIFASLPLAAGVIGDICGGWFSDEIIKKTGRIKFARKVVAVTGFLIAAVVCPIAVLEPDPYISAALFCLAVFGLELVVGNARAVSLDIGGNFAGSVSSVMNTLGNIGGTVMAMATGYIVASYGWNMAFFVVAGLCADRWAAVPVRGRQPADLYRAGCNPTDWNFLTGQATKNPPKGGFFVAKARWFTFPQIWLWSGPPWNHSTSSKASRRRST